MPTVTTRVLSSRLRSPDGTSFVEHRPEHGSDRTVILLHGIGGNALSCTDVAARLASYGARALSWDAPGYGRSRDPRSAVDPADRLAGIISAMQWGPVEVVGTSWGGVIATCLAYRRPRQVRSIVLADSTRGSATTQEKAAAMRSRVPELEQLGSEEFAARRADRLVSRHAEGATVAAVRQQMARVRVPGYRAAAEFMAATDTGALLSRITKPTLVIVGEDDVVTGVPESRLLAERIPGAELTLIPRAGHAAITERPDEVTLAITTFWDGTDG